MASAQPLINHAEIRRWAEQRGARPACVKGSGGGDDPGILRLDFPALPGETSRHEISWEEWFERFDDADLALLVQEHTAGGERSNFNRLVERASLDDN
jgi:hypothetical protein